MVRANSGMNGMQYLGKFKVDLSIRETPWSCNNTVINKNYLEAIDNNWVR